MSNAAIDYYTSKKTFKQNGRDMLVFDIDETVLSNLDAIRGRNYAAAPSSSAALQQSGSASTQRADAGANSTTASRSSNRRLAADATHSQSVAAAAEGPMAPALSPIKDIYLAAYEYGLSVRVCCGYILAMVLYCRHPVTVVCHAAKDDHAFSGVLVATGLTVLRCTQTPRPHAVAQYLLTAGGFHHRPQRRRARFHSPKPAAARLWQSVQEGRTGQSDTLQRRALLCSAAHAQSERCACCWFCLQAQGMRTTSQ